MKLYELSEAYCSVLEELSEPEGDGHDDERFHALLQGLGEAFNEKVLSIAKIIRSLEADIGSIATEVERLQGRRRYLAGRVDWLKRYLVGEMEAVGREKVRGATMTVSLAKAPPSCEISQEAAVPREFQRVRLEVDRAAILAHFWGTGEVVPGTVIIKDRRYLRIVWDLRLKAKLGPRIRITGAYRRWNPRHICSCRWATRAKSQRMLRPRP